MKSGIQRFERRADGSIELTGRPDVTVFSMAMSERPAWENELGFPVYEEQWDALAQHTALTTHHLEFIVADESETRFPGHKPLRPDRMVYLPCCRLELAHSGYCIGSVFAFQRHAAGAVPGTVGQCLSAKAILWNSALAMKALAGIRRGMFSHACALLNSRPGEEFGTGLLVEVTLTTAEAAGCTSARILKMWEEVPCG